MFNKKLKRSVKEIGREITAMRTVNATIRTLYNSFESEIKKIKEKLEKFDGDIKREASAMFNLNMKYTKDENEKLDNRISIIADSILKLEERTENRLGELNDRVSKLEDDIRGLTSSMKYSSEQEVKTADVLKEFIKTSGYEISIERNKDYMKAYQVKITKNGRDNIEGTEKKNK